MDSQPIVNEYPTFAPDTEDTILSEHQ